MGFKQFLIEQEKQQKVFKETDGRSKFPDNAISALRKKIGAFAKELDRDWKSPAELVDEALKLLDVPKPMAFLKDRWEQYVELVSYATEQLYKARGLNK